MHADPPGEFLRVLIPRLPPGAIAKESMGGRGFPGSPVVRTLRFQCRGPGSIPRWELRSCKTPGVAKEKKEKIYGSRTHTPVFETRDQGLQSLVVAAFLLGWIRLLLYTC